MRKQDESQKQIEKESKKEREKERRIKNEAVTWANSAMIYDTSDYISVSQSEWKERERESQSEWKERERESQSEWKEEW